MEDIKIADQLCSFIQEFSDDFCCLELILFFGRHPNARFNRTAILHAPRSARQFDSGLALKRLIDRKLLVTFFENGITLYALTKEEPTRGLVLEIQDVDQHQWQMVLEQILKAQGIE